MIFCTFATLIRGYVVATIRLDKMSGAPGKYDISTRLFFPTLLGMMFNSLITIADGIFVGRGVGPDGIAAVNVIAPIYMVATGIGLMFGIFLVPLFFIMSALFPRWGMLSLIHI